MSNQFSSMRVGTIFAVSVFGMVLLFVGAMFQEKMGELLTYYTENQTRRQAETLAGQAAEKLGVELENLAYIASKIEAHPEETERLMPLILNESGVRQGLLGINGQALYGDSLALHTYDGIQTSFRGKNAVTFVQGQGILFTCPVFHGKNIKYVLYRLYSPETIAARFSISCYDDIGKALVITRDGDIIIPFAQSGAEDIAFIQSREMQEYYRTMNREMDVSAAAARTFSTERGDMLLFESEIPGTDYLVAGFVPKDAASEGIGSITLLVVWVFGLLILLVGLGAVYLVRVRVQIHDSEELQKAKSVAEDASRAKSDFLAHMSHEIRTPINAVLGMNEMILRECGDQNILAYAENVKSAGNTLLGLINDILDFSKIESGKVEIIPTEYDLSSTLNDLVNMIQIRADSKGLTLTLDFDKDTPRLLFGDEIRVKQVITNILTNAVKYTEHGKVTFSVGYERVKSAPEEVLLRIAVADTGIGIKKKDLSKLFSEFERIEEKRNHHVEGTGLGMSITKRLLSMMGSSLKVESVYGAGSVFSFALRQKVTKWEPLGDYGSIRQKISSSHRKYKQKFMAVDGLVLAVDDNPMNLIVFRNLLKQTQVRIETANSGDEALLLARDKQYDIIFLDHMMPGKNGIETLHLIRKRKSNLNFSTPIICLTANAISGAREQYLAAGFDDYLTKPIDPEALERMLMDYLPETKIEMVSIEEAETAKETETPAAQLPEILEPLRKEEWIDLSLGMCYNATADAYLSLLRMFYELIGQKAEALNGFFEEKNFREYTILVHALKTSARLIGAADFGEKAQKLEDAGKREDMEYIRAHHRAFLDEYLGFQKSLSSIFPKEVEQTSEKPEADAERMKNIYAELRSAADEMDCDRLEDIFHTMEKYRIPEKDSELWKQLRTASEQYEYDTILTLLADRRP